jgi:hypothetical protein
MRFDQIEDSRRRTRAVHGENLADAGATAEDSLEHLLLKVKRPIEPRTGVEPNFPPVSRLR